MAVAERRATRNPQLGLGLAWAVLAATLGSTPVAGAPSAAPDAIATAEDDVRRLIGSYERAIETKDLALFRSVKPNMSGDEKNRLQAAFSSIGSHEVTIKILSIEIQGEKAVAQLARRDILEGTILSSFPQTLKLVRRSEGWTIEAIGR